MDFRTGKFAEGTKEKLKKIKYLFRVPEKGAEKCPER